MKFWLFAAALLLTGLAFLYSPGDEINFSDLETECREDRTEDYTVTKSAQDELEIEGFFPVENTRADMNYRYSRSGDTIKINIYSENDRPVEDFQESCNAVGVYKASTDPLEGLYWIELSHNGEKVHRSRIRF